MRNRLHPCFFGYGESGATAGTYRLFKRRHGQLGSGMRLVGTTTVAMTRNGFIQSAVASVNSYTATVSGDIRHGGALITALHQPSVHYLAIRPPPSLCTFRTATICTLRKSQQSKHCSNTFFGIGQTKDYRQSIAHHKKHTFRQQELATSGYRMNTDGALTKFTIILSRLLVYKTGTVSQLGRKVFMKWPICPLALLSADCSRKMAIQRSQ